MIHQGESTRHLLSVHNDQSGSVPIVCRSAFVQFVVHVK